MGHLPVFQHAQEDLAAFRLFTSQLVVNGTVSQAEIARVSRAAENGEALCEAIAGRQREELFRDAAETLSIGAHVRGERASANPAGRGAIRTGGGEKAGSAAQHFA
jgi:hypothetical protein